MAQAFASNGDLLMNTLDNLAGSTDLISVRGRATFTRPFERVEALRRNADDRFRAKEQELRGAAARCTEDKLTALQTKRNDKSSVILTPEQEKELDHFQQEKLRIRKELRAVQAGLNEDINSLGMELKILNIVIVPLVFACAALLLGLSRRRRRQERAAARSGTAAGTPAAVQLRGTEQRGPLMTPRRLAALFIAGLAIIVFAVWLSSQRHLERATTAGQLVLPGMEQALNSITEVPLTKGDETHTTLKKGATDWIVDERGYPADSGKVRKLLLDLASLNVVEEKTRMPANFPQLGVEDVNSPKATGYPHRCQGNGRRPTR